MNDILKNEEFLEKLEDRILDKLSDKVVESIISDKEFAPYLGHEESTADQEVEIKPSKEKTRVERYVDYKLNPTAKEIIEKLRSLSPVDKIPTSINSLNIEKNWEGFVEEEMKKKFDYLVVPNVGAKNLSEIENEEKVEDKMNNFENNIAKIIELGGLKGIKNLTEFYDTIDSIIRRTEKAERAGYKFDRPTTKERDYINENLRDARALSTFNRLSETAAGNLLLSRLVSDSFSLKQEVDGYFTISKIIFDEGEATIEDYNNPVTAHRYIKVKDFSLFNKVISNFQFSTEKAMELREILEYRKKASAIEQEKLNAEYEAKKIDTKEKVKEICKEVEFMSPEFLQAVK